MTKELKTEKLVINVDLCSKKMIESLKPVIEDPNDRGNAILNGLDLVAKKNTVGAADSKCHNCDSMRYLSLESEPWTSLIECNNCGHYSEVIHADRMSGNHSETVRVYKKN